MTRIVLIAALVASISACNKSGTPTSPTPPTSGTPTQAIFYTAIGASDGIGFGGSAPCFPFADCPNGTGYVQTLGRRLAEGGRAVTVRNLSIPAAVMNRATQDLAISLGRTDIPGNFIEQESPFVPTNTTHVTIFAGGNDANNIALGAQARGGSDPTAYVNAQIRQWGADLEDLVGRIRSRAPNARIVALNLPNLAASPYFAGRPLSEKSLMQRVAVGLSDRVNALTSRNVLVVDLMCDARLYLASNYAADGFHPNDSGYAIFAELTLPALRDGTNRAPSTTCSQRTVFP
jgi:lysophospholipase L1-like esterase